jgi:hypothetical protein
MWSFHFNNLYIWMVHDFPSLIAKLHSIIYYSMHLLPSYKNGKGQSGKPCRSDNYIVIWMTVVILSFDIFTTIKQ